MKKTSKPLHDAGKILANPNSTKINKELAAKVLSDKANEKRKSKK